MELKEVNAWFAPRMFKENDHYYNMNALVGELGEVANLLKKQEFYAYNPKYKKYVDSRVEAGKREPWEMQLVDEMGDVFFYFVALANSLGVNLHELVVSQNCKFAQKDIEWETFFRK